MNCRDEILAHIKTMESLPTATAKLIPMLQAPDVDLEEITYVVSHEPGMAASVLRLANAPLFSAGGEVSSVQQAVMRLGTRRMLSVVLSSGMSSLVMESVEGYNLRRGSLWASCVGTAIASEEYASILGREKPDELFLAGLLCDVGKMVLGGFLHDYAGEVSRLVYDDGYSFERAEREVFGIDHAEAGAILLAEWKLPEYVVEVTRWHHEPNRCSEERRDVADLVHLASHACSLIGLGSGDDGSNYMSHPSPMLRLKVKGVDVEEGMANTVAELARVRELFDIPAGSV